MANQEHVDRLLQGVEAWNRWRQENPEIKPDLRRANLRRIDLRYADLHRADLKEANLREADLRETNLIGSYLREADLSHADLFRASLCYTDLIGANLISAYLSATDFGGSHLRYADLREANLREANLREANLREANFSHADLSHADLRETDLTSVNLSSAKLFHADLSNADLSAVQALQASLQTATLTGACIEDWHINSRTNLKEIICEYIFTKHDHERHQFTDRRPHDPNQIFAPGEFTKRYQIVLETVDLFFNDGIDWKAFLASLEDLKAKYGDALNIQGIEKRVGSSIMVRLEVPPDIDKGAFERDEKAFYEAKLKIVEAEHRAELQKLEIQHKDEIIALHRQNSADLKEIIKPRADQPITIEVNAAFSPVPMQQDRVSEQSKEKSKQNQMKALIGILSFVGASIVGVLVWTETVTEKLQSLSDKLGIPLPIPIESAQPQQSPESPRP